MLPIFDFDGVIADSGAAILRVLNILATQRGLATLEPHELRAASTQALLRRMRVRFWEIGKLVRQARRMLYDERHRLVPHPQAVYVLSQLATHATQPVIVSSNAEALIAAFFARHLQALPRPKIVGGVSLFAKHRALKKVLRAAQCRPEAAIYVGDEVRDVQAAHRAGLRCIGVTWGKDAPTLLQQAGAHPITQDGPSLLTAIFAASRHNETSATCST